MNSKIQIKTRTANPRSVWALEQAQVPPLLSRLFANRGVTKAGELDTNLGALLLPQTLLGMDKACSLLANGIKENKSICIVADYDCDGATACAVAISGLRLLGASRITYIVPDRVVDGYGLTPEISKRVFDLGADILITVDNGIASVDGVKVAKELGMQVLITDHHLPGPEIPNADAIVNPNQPGCLFESKNLSGVGVMFYVLMGLRSLMREQGAFNDSSAAPTNSSNSQTEIFSDPIDTRTSKTLQPKLDSLLPLVALGSVADVVCLDSNNRLLVEQGLKRIRSLQMPLGMQCLFEVCSKDPRKATTQDLGFSIGPRINAAGRLSDMTIGIECLLSDNFDKATALATQLHQINILRRSVEAQMLEEAWEIARKKSSFQAENNEALCVFDESFHEGVVGIVASRIKDHYHCPTFVFAPSKQEAASPDEEILKGSGRSIPGFHLRDALDLISKRHPHLLVKFGGHAMAAGCSILAKDIKVFESAFCNVAKEALSLNPGIKQIFTDGPLEPENLSLNTANLLQLQVWGQGFEAPLFCDAAKIIRQRIVGEKHLSMRISIHNQELDAIWFNHTESLSPDVQLVYKLDVDTWSGSAKLKLMVECAL